MHEFALVVSYAFAKHEILHYLVYLKPFVDILLISKAIQYAFQHSFVPFSFRIWQNFRMLDRRSITGKCRPLQERNGR